MKKIREELVYKCGSAELRGAWVEWHCQNCDRKLREGVEGSPDAEKPDWHFCPYCGRIFEQATA